MQNTAHFYIKSIYYTKRSSLRNIFWLSLNAPLTFPFSTNNSGIPKFTPHYSTPAVFGIHTRFLCNIKNTPGNSILFSIKKTCNEHSLQVKYIFGCAFPANALTCERSDSATPPKTIGKLLHSGATVRDFHPIPSLIYFRHPVDIIITPRNRSHKSLNLFINDSLWLKLV